ncbi:MAG: NAD(P)/FAD-dependent oxidoreductase [Clostridium sp.]
MYDLIVVGGGPAGLAAANEAYENGVRNILILERDKELGGILNQCIHNGFGLHTFKEELTGPEYAQRFINMLKDTDVSVKLGTMVLDIEDSNDTKKVHAINPEEGYMVLEGKAVVLTMGCRERTRGAINIPGDRPAGVFTAGAAQRYINMEGFMPGKNVLILGSGDIGLIMARRMSLEGAKVHGVIELMPYSNGLNRNIVQCLNDYDIPLYLSHTVVDIIGKERLEKVIIAEVGPDRKPIKGTEKEFDVDTLLLSVGLIPENELSKGAGIEGDRRTNGLVVSESMETSIPGIFAAGNVVHVHDLVDFVTQESKHAGVSAAKYIKGELVRGDVVEIKNGQNINYTVPQKFTAENIDGNMTVFMRVNNIYHDKEIVVRNGDKVIASFKRKHLAPAEMEKINLPKKLLEGVKGEIVISLE